ncbi:MAG: hypothetical protein AB1545_03615 [Thermodesulfobacteriota bacterium]|jgi:hypothetical protein
MQQVVFSVRGQLFNYAFFRPPCPATIGYEQWQLFLKINDRPVTGLCEGFVMAITLSGQQTLDAGHLVYYD